MRKGSLYRKLILSFSIVIVVSLVCVGIFTYISASKELDVLAQGQMSQIVNNTAHHTDLYLKAYERSIVSLLTSREIKQFIDLPLERTEYLYYQYRTLLRDSYALPSFVRQPDIGAIYIISKNENAVYYFNRVPQEQSYDQSEIAEQLNYFLSVTDKDGGLSIINRSILNSQTNSMLTLVRQIRGLSSPETQGILGIEFRSAEISELWQGVNLGENGYFFIIDENGDYIYHPDSNYVGQSAPKSIKHSILDAGELMFQDEADGVKRMYMTKFSEYSGWYLVVSSPMKELRKPVENIRTVTIVVGLFTFLLAMFIAYRFGKSITVPIRALIKGMKLTEKGNWEMIPLPPHRDEIVELMIRYNLMVNRLSELVEKVYEADLRNQVVQMERQHAEFQSLQLQINPHFLYNTLETIVSYAYIQDSKEITEIVKALAYMLRYSVQTNLEEITVANELKHVMHFMNVLRHRIDRDFEIEETIDPKYLLYKMVRLTMQPLVENVFQHAFPEGIEDYHYVLINAGEQDESFWISIEDNGCGMSEEKLRLLRQKLKTNKLANDEDVGKGGKGGIGLLNVHRRIQMVFGEQYGLQVESEADVGTKMIMMMPIPLLKDTTSSDND